MSNKNVTIKDGIINIPYNFNNEKYIVGIENKETNEIKVSKTKREKALLPLKRMLESAK
jgi:quinolinate synthase